MASASAASAAGRAAADDQHVGFQISGGNRGSGVERGAGRGVGRDGHDGSSCGAGEHGVFWCKHDVEVDLVVGTVDGTAVGRGSGGMFGGVDDQAVLDAEYRVGRQVLVARDEDVRDQGAVAPGRRP